MDFANMRRNGVRSISVQCIDGNSRTVNMDDYPVHLAVKSFKAAGSADAGAAERTCDLTGWTFRPGGV
jgi:hypothetical protein